MSQVDGYEVAPEEDFAVTYDGPALLDRRMEVRELAPALLALANLFSEANSVVDPNNPPVSLNIKATEPASFDVALTLVQVAQNTAGFLASQPVTALANLTTLVLSPHGLFNLTKWLQGRRPEAFRVRRRWPGSPHHR